MTDLARLNERGVCEAGLFDRSVSGRSVDMNDIPSDLRDFDFAWSACAFEHLGSIDKGLDFVEATLDCVKPGGVVVHTTEFNVSSDRDTVAFGSTVLFRRKDMERLAARLEAKGHTLLPVDYDLGEGVLDDYCDIKPYREEPHLRLLIGNYKSTSIGLIARRAK
jgi:hypothetical protein